MRVLWVPVTIRVSVRPIRGQFHSLTLSLRPKHFWVAPLVAGCVSPLVGITERVYAVDQCSGSVPGPSTARVSGVAGDSGPVQYDDPSLQVDVTALEAAEAASRPAQQAAQPAVKEPSRCTAREPPLDGGRTPNHAPEMGRQRTRPHLPRSEPCLMTAAFPDL